MVCVKTCEERCFCFGHECCLDIPKLSLVFSSILYSQYFDICHQQGLRTLELCVDNLQPDFLYDHIQPVRAELFQVSEQYNFETNNY